MEIILLVGHGSPKEDANNLEQIARLLHNMIHPDCGGSCVRTAYLQFAKPDIKEALRRCVDDGARRIIIHPYFLSSGMHVTKDIPEIIESVRSDASWVEFVYTEPLGINTKLVQVVLERIKEAVGLTPQEIEKRSFEILSEEIDLSDVPPERLPVVQRVIHSTADVEFKSSLIFHPDAITTGVAAIKSGKDIITDVEMVKAGIDKKLLSRWGGRVVCKIQGSKFKVQNSKFKIQSSRFKAQGSRFKVQGSRFRDTQTAIGIEMALKGNNIGIVAIGNSPTALLKTIEIFNNLSPATRRSTLVVGVPVGFVKAVESKALLARQDFPFITNLGRKGGTPVAVAIVNALLKIAGGNKE